MKDIAMTISGMSCGHCLNAVNKALATVPDIEVRAVTIGRAELRLPDAGSWDPAKTAIEKAGYKVDAVLPA